jgi:hypothetical protein
MMMQGDIKNKIMNEDLLSAAFSNNIDKKLIQRYISMLFVVIILFSVFTLLNFTDWYLTIKKVAPIRETLLTKFHYKIQPVLVVIEAAIAAIALINYLKAQKLILLSFENENAELFNKGYRLMNDAIILNIAGYGMLISSICYRMFLTHIIG